MSDLDALLDALADRLAPRIADRLRSGAFGDLIDQHASPLGARRHCAFARKLLSRADPDASKVGRRWLIRRERLELELAGGSKAADKPTTQAALAAELGIKVLAGGRVSR